MNSKEIRKEKSGCKVQEANLTILNMWLTAIYLRIFK